MGTIRRTIMFLVLFISVFLGYVAANDEDLKVIDSIKQNPSCLQAGGTCTIAADCPTGQLADPGLCPKQCIQGVECCYGISVKETRCQKYGGECIKDSEYCNEKLIKTNVNNCPDDFKCCVRV